MDRIALKAKAKEQIKGKIGILFVIHLIVFAISCVANIVLGYIPVVGPIVNAVLITPAFALSILKVYINLSSNIAPVSGDAFEGFHDFWTGFKVQFLVGFFTFLWSLLFIIPGIVKAYSYSMAMYIAAENKGISALEAIRRSKEMTQCRKMDLFIRDLSFIGWVLLTALTFGIAGIWTVPYMQATYTNYYNDLKPIVTSNTTAEEASEEKPSQQEAIEA